MPNILTDRLTPAEAITIFALGTGILGGLGQIILTQRIKKIPSVNARSVVVATAIVGFTILAYSLTIGRKEQQEISA